MKKIYVLEPAKSYLKYLEVCQPWFFAFHKFYRVQPLEQSDPRVKVYPQHGREWEVYTKLRNDGAFDGVAQTDWNEGEISSIIRFTSHNALVSTPSVAVYNAYGYLGGWRTVTFPVVSLHP